MIEVGHSAEVRRRFTPAELSALGAADRVPEPLLAALISMLLGMYLPGQGTNYLKQSIAFPAPAPPDAEIVARVTVMSRESRERLLEYVK